MFLNIGATYPVAEFIDPDWGDKVNSGIGLSSRPPGYVSLRAGTTACAGVDFIPQSWFYEFGYSMPILQPG
jgi:hypothetical protein